MTVRTPVRVRRRVAIQPKREIVLGVPGQRTPVRVRVAAIRAAFLVAVSEVSPDVLLDLMRHEDPCSAVSLNAWARHWHLCGRNGRAATWVVKAARETLRLWHDAPTLRGRTFALPSGGAWWLEQAESAVSYTPAVKGARRTDRTEPVLQGSSGYRSARPLYWLAQRLAGRLTETEIAREAGVDPKAVGRELRRQAVVLGLHLPAGRRGRPPRQTGQ